jgi:hypothetical protein
MFLVLFLVSAAPSVIGDWRFLYLGRTGNLHSVSFIDDSSVQRHGGIVRYWEDERFNQEVGNDRFRVNRLVALKEVNCTERKVRELASSGYLNSEFSIDMQPLGKWEYAVPDTNEYGKIDHVCHGKWGDKSVDRDRATQGLFRAMDERWPSNE